MCVRLLLFVERFLVIESNIAGKLVVPGGGWGRPGVARGGRRHLVMYRGGQLAKFIGEKKVKLFPHSKSAQWYPR